VCGIIKPSRKIKLNRSQAVNVHKLLTIRFLKPVGIISCFTVLFLFCMTSDATGARVWMTAAYRTQASSSPNAVPASNVTAALWFAPSACARRSACSDDVRAADVEITHTNDVSSVMTSVV